MAKAVVQFGAGNMGRDVAAEWHKGGREAGYPDVSEESNVRQRAHNSHDTIEAGEGIVSTAPDNHRVINPPTRDALVMAETTPARSGRILPFVDTDLAAAAHHGIDRFWVSTGEALATPTQPGLAR